jgi:chromosome segregation ATPase
MRPTAPSTAALLLATLVTGSSPAGPAAAQQRDPRSVAGPVALQLAEINETMAQMHELLARQLETQTLDLLLKRTQLASAEVARLDRTLRRSLQKRTGLDRERADLELREERLDDVGLARRESRPPIVDLEQQKRSVRTALERVEGQIREIDAEIVELEGQLDRRLRDLETWEAMLDERLANM